MVSCYSSLKHCGFIPKGRKTLVKFGKSLSKGCNFSESTDTDTGCRKCQMLHILLCFLSRQSIRVGLQRYSGTSAIFKCKCKRTVLLSTFSAASCFSLNTYIFLINSNACSCFLLNSFGLCSATQVSLSN